MARRTPDPRHRPATHRAACPHPAEARHRRDLDHQLETAQAGIREWLPKITQAAPDLTKDPALPVLAATLARLDIERGDVGDLLQQAVGRGALPDEHPADALGYRITGLIKTQHEAQTRSGRPVTTPPRRHHHQPLRMSGPSHGISI